MTSKVRRIETDTIPINLVTISIDPNDAPAILPQHALAFEADSERWHLATGTPERVRWVIGGGFSVFYKELENGEFKFDPAFILIDGSGILRAEYRTATPDINIILRDIGLLIEEAQNINGPSRYAYEAAHLFLCYPR